MFKELLKKIIEEKYSSNSKFAEEAGLSAGHLVIFFQGEEVAKKVV